MLRVSGDYTRVGIGIATGLFSSGCATQLLVPRGMHLPPWCAPMTLAECQERTCERPRLYLSTLLDRSRHSSARRPPEVDLWPLCDEWPISCK